MLILDKLNQPGSASESKNNLKEVKATRLELNYTFGRIKCFSFTKWCVISLHDRNDLKSIQCLDGDSIQILSVPFTAPKMHATERKHWKMKKDSFRHAVNVLSDLATTSQLVSDELVKQTLKKVT